MSQARQWSFMAIFAAATLALLAASAEAQQGGGGGRRGGGGMGGPGGGAGRLGLLSSEQVQKELEMVDDQKQAVEKLRDEAREEMRGLFGGGGGGDQEAMQKKMIELREKNEKKVQAILLPVQYDRLKQIDLQVRGAGALVEKEVAESLTLSEEQKTKLTSIRDEFQTKRGELFQRGGGGGGGGGGNDPERRAKMDELRKAEGDQMLAVLTPDQKSKFESMKGKIIEIDRAQMGFGFGGGGRRGGGQGGGGQGGSTP